MKDYKLTWILITFICESCLFVSAGQLLPKKIALSQQAKEQLADKQILFIGMNADGSGISQIGVSTLFEGHSSLLSDGRILYDRWEYVDRNFGDAQGLWTYADI